MKNEKCLCECFHHKGTFHFSFFTFHFSLTIFHLPLSNAQLLSRLDIVVGQIIQSLQVINCRTVYPRNCPQSLLHFNRVVLSTRCCWCSRSWRGRRCCRSSRRWSLWTGCTRRWLSRRWCLWSRRCTRTGCRIRV